MHSYLLTSLAGVPDEHCYRLHGSVLDMVRVWVRILQRYLSAVTAALARWLESYLPSRVVVDL